MKENIKLNWKCLVLKIKLPNAQSTGGNNLSINLEIMYHVCHPKPKCPKLQGSEVWNIQGQDGVLPNPWNEDKDDNGDDFM